MELPAGAPLRAADIERVLRYPSAYPLRPPNEADVFYRRYRKEYYPNDGVVSLNGPDWHKLRMQLTPPLTRYYRLSRSYKAPE